MKIQQDKLKRIKTLTDLKADVSKARYAARKAEVQAIQDGIEDLINAKKTDPTDSLPASKAAAKFQGWAATRQAELQNDLALALARAQPFKEKAGKDEARTQVVARLHKRAKS